MIPKSELRKRARSKLKDSEVLFDNRRYDGSLYLCGYVIELILKGRICRTLKWSGFPETRGEFQNLQSYKTHNLDILLKLSGVENKVKLNHFLDWNIVNQWNPEMRYGDVGIVTVSETRDMMNAIRNLMNVIK